MVSIPSEITEAHTDKSAMAAKRGGRRVFRVYKYLHSGEIRRIVDRALSYYRVSMYTAIAQTRNIHIEASSLLLDTTSMEKRSYQYNRFSTLNRYQYSDSLYRSDLYIWPTLLVSS